MTILLSFAAAALMSIAITEIRMRLIGWNPVA
jgi:hypothetical protein